MALYNNLEFVQGTQEFGGLLHQHPKPMVPNMRRTLHRRNLIFRCLVVKVIALGIYSISRNSPMNTNEVIRVINIKIKIKKIKLSHICLIHKLDFDF